MDTTEFTRASISDVVHTFFEALVLVVIVVFVFLQSLRATLIPVLAVPVSIVGTFMGMLALGFSINMLTLFGMVLAIGIVVDDAIVVIENVERNMTVHKLNPKDAAKLAMDEVAGPGHRDRARAVRGVRAGGVPRRHYRPVVQAVRDHHRDLGGDLGARRADVVAGARRVAAQDHGITRSEAFFDGLTTRSRRMTAGYTRAVQLVIKRFVVALLLFAGMIALAVVMLKSDPERIPPAGGSGLPARRGHHAGRGEPRSHRRRSPQHVTDYFMKQAAVGSITVVDGYSLLDSQNKNNASRRSLSVSRVSTNATQSPTSGRRTPGPC